LVEKRERGILFPVLVQIRGMKRLKYYVLHQIHPNMEKSNLFSKILSMEFIFIQAKGAQDAKR
jgi:hypothetical protein